MCEIPGEKEVVQGVFFCKFTHKVIKYLKNFPYPLSINCIFL